MFNGARVHQVQAALMGGDLGLALAILNAKVPHRYSAVYSLEDQVFLNRFFCDKSGEAVPASLAVVPLEHSFCRFVVRDGFFQTIDSSSDARLDGSRYQGVIRSYTAAPITDSTGQFVIGSICHFDMVAQRLSEAEFDLLKRAGRMISARMLNAGAVPVQVQAKMRE